MSDLDPLVFAFDMSASGVKPLAWQDLQADAFAGAGVRRWIHLDRMSEAGFAWLKQSRLIPDFICDILFQHETRPRAFTHDDAVSLNLRGVNLNEGHEPEDLVSLRLYATETLLVTTRAHQLATVDDLKRLVEQGKAPASNASMLVYLAHGITGRLEDVSQRLEEQVDALEDDMLDENTPPPKLAVAEFRRAVLSLRRYITPQREAVSSLLREADDFLSDRDRLTLRETQDIVFRLSEQLDMVRERAVVLQEQIIEIRAEAMNQRLFVLAIISAIFLPLGFVTGLFGVNVGGMPGVDSPAAFWVLCVVMLGLVGVLLLVFKKMKWL